MFVHLAPEKNENIDFQKNKIIENEFNISSGRFRSKLKPPQSPIILNLTK